MLIFEKSRSGRNLSMLPPCDVEIVLPQEENRRELNLHLPEVSEIDLSRHYSEIERKTLGVNNGFYPLGSCTMKYNPRINDEIAGLPGFAEIHPLQPANTVQGCMEVIQLADKYFSEITGMDRMTFQPAAGAHGEFTGIMMIKKYHDSRGDTKRNKIIVPDSAHGTNPATATMVGMKVISVPSDEDGCVDMEKFKAALGDDIAGLMLTNPNTLGIFDKNILEITKLVHECGGLNYYDGANLNAVMGMSRPGDMGFDVIHLNLHKTFSTPHGGGGPGSGAVGCKKILEDFLPSVIVEEENNERKFVKPVNTIGDVKSFYGNFLIYLRALTYVTTLGKEGVELSCKNAVLNANYMLHKLKDIYPAANKGACMHEFVLSLEDLKKETGVSAMDVAKGLIDYGIHPPTMYFPLIVHEALMVEPTETESKETLDNAIKAFRELHKKAYEDPEALHEAPVTTRLGRLDEVGAARNPILRYKWED